ncbi:MAG: FdhF/YdeP family oxidoreductase [Pyrinomonadaceae bacterium]
MENRPDQERTAHSGAQSPEDPSLVRIKPLSKAAGGIPSIIATARSTWNQMGVTRGVRTLLKVNQKTGFDCPGCAWPEPDDERSHAEFCENGAKHVADEATTRRITPAFFSEWSVADLADKSDHWLNKQGRLTHPMALRRGATHYEPIPWTEAFSIIANELNSLSHPDEGIFYTSGRTSNEAAFLYQLFVRQFGTNNLPDCSNMCHESSGAALGETIGVSKGTVTLADFNLAQAIFVIGQNPGTNHPRMLSALEKAKQNGCKLVHINPLPEVGMTQFKHPQDVLGWLGGGTTLADLFVQVRINGDVALLQGIAKALFAEEGRRPGEVLDRHFIDDYTSGFNEFAAAIISTSWNDIVEESSVEQSVIEEAAKIFIESECTIFCWAMGLTQHKNAVANIQEIVNLMLLRGQIGKPGAGVCPVRGHSNVQGDRTMGIWERPSDTFLNNLAGEFNFEPPRRPGYDTVKAIEAMHSGRARVFFSLGGNFLSATPDTEYTAQALRQCSLTAHVSTKLNRAHLITGAQALILPCLGRTETDMQPSGPQFVTTENSMAVVQASRGFLTPASDDLLSEPAIVSRLAIATLGSRSGISWQDLTDDYDRIRDHIARVVPGFDDYNARIRRPGGFHLPSPARARIFNTPSGRAMFTVHALPQHNLAPDQFLMMTIRSHDQFNTTIYGLDDRYRGIYNGRRVVLLNAEDIGSANLIEGQRVDLFSHFEGEQRVARNFIVVPYSIPRRCAATYFPETNVLVALRNVADKSNTPVSKSVVITIKPAAEDVSMNVAVHE